MKKLISFVLGASMFLMAAPAFAATISNPLFSNGQTSIDATGSATVSGTFTLTVGPGEVIEWLRTQSDPSMPFVDTSVGGTLGYQEQVYTNVPFSVKVPPNTGTFYPTVQGAGTFGGNRSINGGDNVNFGATNLGTVRVVASASASSDSAPSGIPADVWAKFMAWISGSGSTTPAPTVNPKCAALSAKMSAGMYGTVVPGNVVLQGYLLSEGASIPALAAGASFGFWGPQTQNAINVLKASNSCQ